MSEAYKGPRVIEEQKTAESPVSVVMKVNDRKVAQRTIVDIFEEQARRAPSSIAVEHETRRVTYEELNRRSNQLAHHLRALGVGPEILVGICVQRSVEMVAGLLGILKAGGAYVPLDASYPEERLRYMIEDAGLHMVVTGAGTEQLMALQGTRLVRMESEREQIGRERDENLGTTILPENLAYVIYTSGSTGRPKGVGVEHQGLSNYVEWSLAAYLEGVKGKSLVHSPLSFDLTVTSLFLPLIGGRGVKLISEGKEVENLGEVLAGKEEWGLIKLTPSHLRLLSQTLGEEAEIKGNGRLVIGGEALRWADLAHWRRVGQDLRFINEYGPTETVVGCCIYEVRGQDEEGGSGGVPIGQPIANTQIYILDGDMNPTPPGSTGEIYIGGAGVARGYVNRAALTGERFVPNPFGATGGERMYRTGDIGRYREDGNIEYAGRVDEQVKIRGYRIELGEIETVLEQHPGIGQAVALMREDIPGDKRLMAYIVERPEKRVATSDLHEFLMQKLPEYMVPSALVLMDALPITPNGKVDRHALPAPDGRRPVLEQPYIAPQTGTEKQLAEIWAKILRIDRIGAQDDFFDLGGNSLLAGQVLSEASKIYGRLPLRSFFENRTLGELARCFDGIRQEKPESDIPPIGALPRSEKIPLGFSQERVWFLCHLNPDNLSYNFQALLRFRGYLSVPSLEWALSEIIRRHEILRTTLHEEQGSLVQVVHPPFPVMLPVVDLQHSADPQKDARTIIDAELKKQFDLEQLPLIYWVLMRTSSEEHVLFHKEHHLIHDGWSYNLFLYEMFELYRSAVNQLPSPFRQLPTQFADFAIWQRKWMETEDAARQLSYWEKKLAGAPGLLVLPWDHPRAPYPSNKGGQFRMELPMELCKPLRERARKHKVTLFMAMLAGFAVLLRRLSGETELCIGSGVASRRPKETHSLIGMLVNNVVFRLDLSGNPTVTELFEQVWRVTIEAYDNQDIPFDRMVEVVHPQRSLSYQPLFQVMFSFHDSPLPDMSLPDCEVAMTEGLGNHSAKFDLNIIVIPRAQPKTDEQGIDNGLDGITLSWEYSTDLFDAATMEHWIAAYQNLLFAMASDAGQHIDHLPLLPAEQTNELVNEAIHPVALPQQTIHGVFEHIAQQRLNVTAAVCSGREITYEDLNKRANQVAHYLIQAGVHLESRVGICLEPSLEMVIGILGILKTGAAYVPMDSSYPVERLAYMMEDAEISLLLTQEELKPILPNNNVRWICLNDRHLVEQEDTNPQKTVNTQNAAYVIYTSGSTGKPKGVEVTHGNVLRLFEQTQPWFAFNSEDVWTVFHSFAFDFSVWELWGAFFYGGRAVIVPRWVARSSEDFYDLLASQGVTVLSQSPAAFQQLIGTDELRAESGRHEELALRYVIFGAEALDFPSLREWMKRHEKQPQLINMYGITETTVHVTYCPVHPADLDECTVGSRIGIPIGDLSAYVLDENGDPMPVGGRGELHVGGKGLARGYLKRPDLTAERFLPNPFSQQPGARMYRTGDLARTRADGTLEYLGRIDRQVKIRGYRIELGEIESRLMEYGGVKQAAVLAREDVPGEKRLVAYYTVAAEDVNEGAGHDAGNIRAEQLRKYLGAELPEYMVPAAYVRLESMPLTTNGKLDRKALPPPDGDAYVAYGYEAPQGEVERELAAIWAEVLKREEVGRHDNFFSLGGHSLMAMRIIARANAIFRVEIPVRLLFEKPTIRDFGESIRQLASSNRTGQDARISRIPREGRMPLSLNQEGRLLVEWWAAMHSAPIAPFQFYVAFSLGPEISVVTLERALNVLASRHEILRTTFSDPRKMSLGQLPPEIRTPLAQMKAGKGITAEEMRDFVNRLIFGTSIFEQTIHPDVNLKVAQIDLQKFSRDKQESELLRTATEAIETPFDYESAPLMRALLFRKSPTQQILLIVMPHLLGDGWSVEIFRKELATLCEALTLGTSWNLPDLPIQAVDFAAWQRRQLQGTHLEKLTSYWKRRWSEFSLLDVQDLPFAKPSPENPRFTAETMWQTLDRSLTRDVRFLLRERNITLHMLWLAALNILLHLYTRKERIGVWGLFANRIQPETENLMGWLANGHILGTQVAPEQEIDDLLAHVRDVVLAAHSHQEIPMALLWSHFMKDLERNPGSGRAPIQPHISFVTETQTDPRFNTLMEEAQFPYRISRLALKLVAVDNREDIRIFIRYSADRFSSESISRMLTDWQQIAQKIIDSPCAKISEFAAVLQSGNPADFLLAG